MSDTTVQPETNFPAPSPENESIQLSPEQREQVTEKLKQLARGMNNPQAALDATGVPALEPIDLGIGGAEGETGPHSSHYDNDGWF